ncbi:MAG TPA: type II CAAX endopeptidase family protein [Bacteroidales bacterium]|nr:type II CAAX endopeptidase family protein [Bacteroidales bacterium]
MNAWSKILVFFPLWLFFQLILYVVAYLFYPELMPAQGTDLENWYEGNIIVLLVNQVIALTGTFATVFFVHRFVYNNKPNYLKAIFKPKGLLAGILTGIIALFCIIIILSISTGIRVSYNGFSADFYIYLLIFFLVAISEEVLARGAIFSTLFQGTNKYVALIVSSLIFSFLHIFNTSFNWVAMLNLFIVGILFCQLYLKRTNLSIPIGFHFSWNFLQGPVLGFAVSGIPVKGILSFESTSGSGFSFTGFGLEGSYIATIVIFIMSVYFYLSDTRRKLNTLSR